MSAALPPGPYLVLDAAVCEGAGHDPLDVVDAAAHAGLGVVQLRAKDRDVRALLDLTVAAAGRLARFVGPPALVVDDRVDVVLAARRRGARVDGVHLGQSDLPAVDARRLLGAGTLIGVSAARDEDVDAALRTGVVDYLGAGPVRATPTKPDAADPIGLDGLAEVARRSTLPVVAIGGLTVEDAEPVRLAGAVGLAVVSAVCSHPAPYAAATELVAAWARARSHAASAS
ncbi:thiamine phosphate synthase [Cellulomonas sp. NS3]|uniref:thiamine phosphate synthase n=1 Tax=Cellulomonas sp. NS3 TaxID=2973977 RepID=UPI002162296C|nr:thiamine phosphate synthase [Cellulomonas sp. NS3]